MPFSHMVNAHSRVRILLSPDRLANALLFPPVRTACSRRQSLSAAFSEKYSLRSTPFTYLSEYAKKLSLSTAFGKYFLKIIEFLCKNISRKFAETGLKIIRQEQKNILSLRTGLYTRLSDIKFTFGILGTKISESR